MVWLAASEVDSGRFWLDRRARSTVRLPWTRYSDAAVEDPSNRYRRKLTRTFPETGNTSVTLPTQRPLCASCQSLSGQLCPAPGPRIGRVTRDGLTTLFGTVGRSSRRPTMAS